MNKPLFNTIRFDAALLLLRVMVGTVFIFHGSQKLFGAFGGSGIDGFSGFLSQIGVPFPVLSAWLAGGAEFVGGVALVAGIALPLAVIPMIVTMLVASFTVHGGAFSGQSGGMEYPLTLAVVLAAIGMLGAGRFSLAAVCASRCSSACASPALARACVERESA